MHPTRAHSLAGCVKRNLQILEPSSDDRRDTKPMRSGAERFGDPIAAQRLRRMNLDSRSLFRLSIHEFVQLLNGELICRPVISFSYCASVLLFNIGVIPVDVGSVSLQKLDSF